jgi:hypothetical protein
MIYFLLVMEFRDFRIPLIIMAPIPLTLLGIVPGHWLLGAEFTATSMIGFIALAGIIVRNSILLVDFALHELGRGVPLNEALLNACQARTRPILITALALVGGSAVILTDPIFQGMAVSLLFGVLVSTLLTLLVVPLGCLAAGRTMAACRRGTGGARRGWILAARECAAGGQDLGRRLRSIRGGRADPGAGLAVAQHTEGAGDEADRDQDRTDDLHRQVSVEQLQERGAGDQQHERGAKPGQQGALVRESGAVDGQLVAQDEPTDLVGVEGTGNRV